MIKYTLVIFSLLLLSNGSVFSQESTREELINEAIWLSEPHPADSMKLVTESFVKNLGNYLKIKESFQDRLADIEIGALLYPPDSSFRIYTLELPISNSNIMHFGWIQTQDSLFVLTANEAKIRDKNFINKVLDPAQWYGALYYNIHPSKTKKGKIYTLFGYSETPTERMKILDILYFENGKPKFGMPIWCGISNPETCQHRVFYKFGKTSSFKCNYDPEYGKIILDHLIMMPSPSGDLQMVPDGSYDAFEWKKKQWRFKEMVWHDVQEAPPIDSSTKKNAKKDIFGK
jgi:hypothetical protein